MSPYYATIAWQRAGAVFTDGRYHRAHRWRFDGGLDVPGSSSPDVVPLPFSDPGAVDPEEAFVAALASCHMLCFLWIASTRGFVVEHYRDDATGVMGPNAAGKLAMTAVRLHPHVAFADGHRPTPSEHEAMHHEAHGECFLARSVTTDVRCEARDVTDVRAAEP